MTAWRVVELVAAGVGVLLVLVATALLRAARREAARAARAVATSAVVVEVDTHHDDRTIPRVRYRDQDGVEHEQTPRMVRTARRRWRVRGRVAVRFDPQDPRWVIVDGAPTEADGLRVAAAAAALAALLAFVTAGLVLAATR